MSNSKHRYSALPVEAGRLHCKCGNYAGHHLKTPSKREVFTFRLLVNIY